LSAPAVTTLPPRPLGPPSPPRPRPGEADLASFFGRVRRARRRALLLDYDGTLAPFRVDRGRARPYPGVRAALAAILADGRTRLVVASGRPAADVASLLDMHPSPEVWGSHGWERRLPDGAIAGDRPDPVAGAGLARARLWAARVGLAASCEAKPAGLALHWRGLADREVARLRRLSVAAWDPIAREAGLTLLPFDGGLELRVPGRGPAWAIRTILDELGADGVAAFLGDDLADEEAFRAIAGRGLGALVRPDFRPTAAAAWLRPPQDLLAFLDRWRRAAAAGDPGAGRSAGRR
jgi:trehalose-phosphatase